jgi:hypothetical protein
MSLRTAQLLLACGCASLALAQPSPEPRPFEHREFNATLEAPFQAPSTRQRQRPTPARTFTLHFDYPEVLREQIVDWRLDLLDPAGQPLRQWSGAERLWRAPVEVAIRWDGKGNSGRLPPGVYGLRLRALARDADAAHMPLAARPAPSAQSEAMLAAPPPEPPANLIEQRWEIAVGALPARPLPAFRALPSRASRSTLRASAAAAASLPYTIYYANLHSQTSHSDGGGKLPGCHGAQPPQHGAFGPSEAYDYARRHGLDILMTSEHNHMYDGSDGTNSGADPAAAKALYRAGRTSAAAFNAAHPDFLAIYGQEWGVIKDGGHLNILNGDELLGWELNGDNQLLADTFTPKNDYAALYALMRQRGWLGQFNHPAQGSQFKIGGAPFGYSADGDQAMALCEVMNSDAFSANDTETETGHSNYEAACDKALEAGFHLAFSSNQDNHCANWGAAYTNRTGILIPNGTPLSADAVNEALRARRVFATMDKNAQLVLTANGHLMGERFSNAGPLKLVANYASASGRRAASVVILEGVPGRNGAVTPLADAAETVITPAVGAHFYYARLTQDNGKLLWSAPVWVDQLADGARPVLENAGRVNPDDKLR